MTTTSEAIENAARLLRNREGGLVRTYGNAGPDALPLATAWIELARVINIANSQLVISPTQPAAQR